MKTKSFHLTALAVCTASAFILTSCGRQTRGNADAVDENRAATPAEGGATSTAGSAGRPENFGDTNAKTKVDTASPSGRTVTGGASTGPDYSLDSAKTPSGAPVQSTAKPGESPNEPMKKSGDGR